MKNFRDFCFLFTVKNFSIFFILLVQDWATLLRYQLLTFMTYITFSVHGYVQSFIRKTGFCSYFQFYTDANHRKKIQIKS